MPSLQRSRSDPSFFFFFFIVHRVTCMCQLPKRHCLDPPRPSPCSLPACLSLQGQLVQLSCKDSFPKTLVLTHKHSQRQDGANPTSSPTCVPVSACHSRGGQCASPCSTEQGRRHPQGAMHATD